MAVNGVWSENGGADAAAAAGAPTTPHAAGAPHGPALHFIKSVYIYRVYGESKHAVLSG